MTIGEKRARLLVEIEASIARRSWVAAEVAKGSVSVALAKYAFEYSNELDALFGKLAAIDSK